MSSSLSVVITVAFINLAPLCSIPMAELPSLMFEPGTVRHSRPWPLSRPATADERQCGTNPRCDSEGTNVSARGLVVRHRLDYLHRDLHPVRNSREGVG